MNVLIFGSTGMIGQGVLRECLLDPGVQRVVVVNRRPGGKTDPKLREVIHRDLFDLTSIEHELRDIDACFFALGVTSIGLNEEQYSRITYDLTVSIAQTLVRLNPAMTFIFVSGASTDSTERGRVMWARVKGRAENAVLALPFRAAYTFRPGAIIPLHGIRSSTGLYKAIYAVFRPVLPIVKRIAPTLVTTTEQMGRAMLKVTREGYPKRVLEMSDIISL